MIADVHHFDLDVQSHISKGFFVRVLHLEMTLPKCKNRGCCSQHLARSLVLIVFHCALRFTLSAILFLHLAKTDFLLNQVQSLSHLQDAPKKWHTFIRFHLQTFFQKIPLVQLGTSRQFEQMSRESGTFFLKLYARVYQISLPEKPGPCPNNSLVTRASAKLLLSYPQHWTKCASRTLGSSCSWQFHLDKHLDLNITFILINFYLENLSCSNAWLTIYQKILLLQEERFRFCGIYTWFNLYPNHQRFWIDVYSTKCFCSQVHANFISIDRDLLKTCNSVRHFSIIPAFDSVAIQKTNTTIQLFLVEVKKNTHAVLHVTNSCELSVHDGPDAHQNKVKHHNNVYQMSTFQCFVIKKGSRKLKCVVAYGQGIDIGETHFVKQSKSLALPSNKCLFNPKICHYSISSPQGYQVNATISSLLLCKEAQSPNCKHSGLAILEIGIGLYREVSMVCQNISKNFQHNHFYSSNSTLIFVLHWYTWPPPIHVILNLTITECKAVVLDVCFQHSRNILYGAYDRLKAYLKQRTEALGLKLRLANVSTVFFSVEKNRCVVLQLVPNQGMVFWLRRPTCSIRLRPELNWGEAGREIALSISGAMKHANYCDSDIIKFGGSLLQFDFKAQNMKNSNCNTSQCAPYLFISPLSCKNKTGLDVFFSFHTNIKLPIYDYIFYMRIKQLSYGKTWVEIMMRNLPGTKDQTLSLDGPQTLSEVIQFTKKISQVLTIFLTIFHPFFLYSSQQG